MSRHTSGPWYRNIKPATKYTVIFAGPKGNHTHVARVLPEGLSPDEVESNLALIAKAPELLDFLRLFIDLDADQYLYGPIMHGDARALLAEIDGGSNE